jgi:hypothetical protein
MSDPALRMCARCHVAKPVAEFPIKNAARGSRGSYCFPCRSEYGKEHYTRNTDYYKSKATKSRTRDRAANRAVVDAFLSDHPCVDCGETDIVVLDFDHVDPKDKLEAVGRLQHSTGRARLLREIAKCQVRCGNCHRRRTAHQFGWYRVWLAAHV